MVTAGVDGSVVSSANAKVPFLARFTGQGVEPGDGNPAIVRSKAQVLGPPHAFLTLRVMLKTPGLVGVPEIVPVIASMDKPWGRKFALKVFGV